MLEWYKANKSDIAFWVSIASMLGSIGAVAATVGTYVDGKAQHTEERNRDERLQFLGHLNSISDARKEFYTITDTQKDSEYLGSVQAQINSQCSVLLAQAVTLLPALRERGVVTDSEYVLLARESLHQGERSQAKKYADIAVKSANPETKADATWIAGSVLYMNGEMGKGYEEFDDSLEILDKAKELLSEIRIVGKVQVIVTWSEMEIDFGDQSYERAREIIKRGRDLLPRVRGIALRDSARKFFDQKDKEIEERQKERQK